MSSHSPASPALAALRQMACLDLGGPQMIEPVLRELRRAIGFESASYVHPGGDPGAPDMQVYVEDPALQAASPGYFDPHVQRSEGQVFHHSLRQFHEAARHEPGPRMLEQMAKVPYASLMRSDFYDALLRPARVVDWVSLALRTPQGRGFGTLSLYRYAGSPRFRQEEAAAFTPLEASLACVLQPGALDAGDGEVHSQGLLIATPQGRLLWLSPEAEALMPQAFGWRWRRRAELPAALRQMLQRLHPCAEGVDAPPHMEWHNASGWFSLRGTRMAAATGAGQAVGIHITRRVARGARLQAALRALGLPQRQHELAYWLARGLPESQIAERMDISANTVVYHRRQLYNRLGVHDRRELLAWLSLRGGGRLASA